MSSDKNPWDANAIPARAGEYDVCFTFRESERRIVSVLAQSERDALSKFYADSAVYVEASRFMYVLED